jgi:hypothetical protein
MNKREILESKILATIMITIGVAGLALTFLTM